MFALTKTKKYLLIGMMAIFVFSVFLVPDVTKAYHDTPCVQTEIGPQPPGCDPVGDGISIPDIASDAWENLTWFLNPIGNTIDGTFALVVKFITTLLFTFFGILLLLAAGLLNLAINLTIVKMSVFINGIDGIKTAWSLIRDLANIGFIFMIAYIAISTILQISGRGIKELLTKLIIAALLINFSFFFTGVLIDASNIITISVYQRIAGVNPLYSTTFDANGDPLPDVDLNPADPTSFNDLSNYGLAGVFMQATDITGIYLGTRYSAGSSIAIALFGSVFMFMLIFAFLTIATLLFVRLIVLTLLIITSPIAYIGSVFPGANNYSKQWWDTLWGQLLFAPVYMIMTLVIVIIISDPTFNTIIRGSDDEIKLGQAIANGFQTGSIAIIVNYLIIIGLLMASIIGAKKFASQGGSGISSIAGKATGFVDGLRGKAQGAIGRNTAGRLSKIAGDKAEDYRKRQEEDDTGKYSGFGGRLRLKAISGASRSVEGTADKITGAKFGSQLSRAEVIKRDEERDIKGAQERAGDPPKQAAFIANLAPKAQQKVISEMKSAKNRAVLENELEKQWKAQTPPVSDSEIKDRINKLRTRLSAEDVDKTKEEYRKVQKSERANITRDAIEEIATGPTGTTTVTNPSTGAPYTSVADAIRYLPENQAYKLKDNLLAHNDVIDALTPRHLGNIMEKKDDLQGPQIDTIRTRIMTGPTTPIRTSQIDYITDNRRKHYWGT